MSPLILANDPQLRSANLVDLLPSFTPQLSIADSPPLLPSTAQAHPAILSPSYPPVRLRCIFSVCGWELPAPSDLQDGSVANDLMSAEADQRN